MPLQTARSPWGSSVVMKIMRRIMSILVVLSECASILCVAMDDFEMIKRRLFRLPSSLQSRATVKKINMRQGITFEYVLLTTCKGSQLPWSRSQLSIGWSWMQHSCQRGWRTRLFRQYKESRCSGLQLERLSEQRRWGYKRGSHKHLWSGRLVWKTWHMLGIWG